MTFFPVQGKTQLWKKEYPLGHTVNPARDCSCVRCTPESASPCHEWTRPGAEAPYRVLSMRFESQASSRRRVVNLDPSRSMPWMPLSLLHSQSLVPQLLAWGNVGPELGWGGEAGSCPRRLLDTLYRFGNLGQHDLSAAIDAVTLRPGGLGDSPPERRRQACGPACACLTLAEIRSARVRTKRA